MKDNLLAALLATFAPLSLLTIGGGISIIGDVQRAVVNQHHWLTDQSFLDIFAVSRVAPGPGTLIVTLIGWHVAGLSGAIVASLAIFLPSSLLVCGVAYLWHNHPGAIWQRAVATGLAPIAAGLILSSGYTLLASASGGWIAWGSALLVAFCALRLRVGPLTLMGCGALLYLVVAFVVAG